MTPSTTITQPLVERGRFPVRQEPSLVRQEPSLVRQEPSPVRQEPSLLAALLVRFRRAGARRLAARAESAARAHEVARLRAGLEHQRVVSHGLLAAPR